MKKLISSMALLTLGVLAVSFQQDKALLKESIARGKEAYGMYCQNCHMEDGKGQEGVFPPLAKSDFMQKPIAELINVVLKGQTGAITVNGVSFNNIMPAQDYLTSEQIADILNYTRNSWGNRLKGMVTPEQVNNLRE
ncbi:cytochrome c [Hydrotalea sp.]|uniref:c-type cytochrome n=1 Tax=Hydrotalea sp. TaxID=2881279 RepID=UPI0025866898|nr:cytochrome c [Hydrotalea sp.]